MPQPHDTVVAELDASAEEPVGTPADELVDDESLVEEVSIDGMCGVY